MLKETKKPRGRPAEGESAMLDPIAIRFPEAMRLELEKIRSERMDKPQISAVVRELVAEAIDARAKRKARV